MTAQEKKKLTQSPTSGNKQGSIMAGIVIGWSVLWLLGIPQHSYYFVRCGGRLPIQHTSSMIAGFAAGRDDGYLLPSDFQYYHPPYLWTTSFYCSEQDALNDGVAPDPMSASYRLYKDDPRVK